MRYGIIAKETALLYGTGEIYYISGCWY